MANVGAEVDAFQAYVDRNATQSGRTSYKGVATAIHNDLIIATNNLNEGTVIVVCWFFCDCF